MICYEYVQMGKVNHPTNGKVQLIKYTTGTKMSSTSDFSSLIIIIKFLLKFTLHLVFIHVLIIRKIQQIEYEWTYE